MCWFHGESKCVDVDGVKASMHGRGVASDGFGEQNT